MANEVKYNNVVWKEGTPIAGERLATNGFYTGEHKGTVMQDALVTGTQAPYFVEENTIRFGTIMGDAADTNFPTVVVETGEEE